MVYVIINKRNLQLQLVSCAIIQTIGMPPPVYSTSIACFVFIWA